MALYEHIFLARQDVAGTQVEGLIEQYKSVIEERGGKVTKTEYWGIKSLAYRVRKNRKAHFALMNIDAPPAAVTEMERLERINEDVLRWITVSVEELEDGPSIMLQKRERDERREKERGERRRDRRDDGEFDAGQED